MSSRISITETDLHYLVSEAVRRILQEGGTDWGGVLGEFVKYLETIGEYGQLPVEEFDLNEVYKDIGYHTFFYGYTSEGELDEDGFYEFLDGFFEKYGKEVVDAGCDINKLYHDYYPSDVEEALTPEGREKYVEEIVTRGKEWYEHFAQFLTFNDKGQVYCVRAIVLDSGYTADDFMAEFGNGVGIYWSYKDEGARPYYADGVYGPTVILRGWVNPGDVNWGETIQTTSADEMELRLNDGATVQVDSVIHEYTDEPLPLKGCILLPTE